MQTRELSDVQSAPPVRPLRTVLCSSARAIMCVRMTPGHAPLNVDTRTSVDRVSGRMEDGVGICMPSCWGPGL